MIWLVLAAAAIATAITLMYLLLTRTGCDVQTTHLHLTVPGLPVPAKVRVAVMSDLHVGKLHVPAERLIAALQAAKPDLLLLAGDYAAGPSTHPDALELVARLCDGRPTFGVLGNTDHYQRLNAEALREILQSGGGDLLINTVGRVCIGGINIEVLGIDDPLHGGADIEATLAAATGDADMRIGLCHSPAFWRELAQLEAQITVVGHTHGGQIRISGMEAHVTHMTYLRELAAGLFHVAPEMESPQRMADHWQIMGAREPLRISTDSGPLLYVTRGVGMAVLPVRVMCPPELVVIEFERDDADGGGGDDG